MQNIIRSHPIKQAQLIYPKRYRVEIFEKYNKLIQNDQFITNYEKWKNGINYKTNRKIKIGSKTHNELKQNFMIAFTHNYYSYKVLFDELKNINVELYLLETNNIYNDIYNKNKVIQQYNRIVLNTIDKIMALEKWDDYIDFEDKKYGIPIIYDDIHRENDCNGEMIIDTVDEYECNGCYLFNNGSYTCKCYKITITKCNNCSHSESKKTMA